MIVRIFKWILKLVDLAVNIEDGVLLVQLWIGDVLILEWRFNTNEVMRAGTATLVRKVGK